MNMKKLVAVLALFLMVAPGALAAFDTSKAGVTMVKGHTVFVKLVTNPQVNDTRDEDFAAIAAVSIERTRTVVDKERNSVLWFNDQELIPGFAIQSDTTTEACFAGSLFIVPAGSDDPRNDANGAVAFGGYTTLEGYDFKDPNDRSWHAHAFTAPADAAVVGDTANVVVVVGTSAACTADPTLGEKYNSVAIIRMKDVVNGTSTNPATFPGVIANGKAHGLGATNSSDSTAAGNSHGQLVVPVNPHTHNTVLVDIYFGTTAPVAGTHGEAITDTVGSTAPFDPHPCTASDNTETNLLSPGGAPCGNGARA